MAQLSVESTRGSIVESRHAVSVAVADVTGRLRAQAGNPHCFTYLRSAAKPFQAMPIITDSAAERFAITPEELALACGSHNSEPEQVERVKRFLERIGCTERDLACRPHRPLWRESTRLPEAERPAEAPRTPAASNCSGKHAAMLALARHHGWPVGGYHERGHPVQDRVRRELVRFADVPETEIGEGVDGCGVVAFAMPLSKLARAYAALVASDETAACRVVEAMRSYPDLVAGRGRLCTGLMRGFPGSIAKVGAEGVYCAAFRHSGLALALKVEDGSNQAAVVAVIHVLDQLGLEPRASQALPEFAEWPLTNTRGEPVGVMRTRGGLAFL